MNQKPRLIFTYDTKTGERTYKVEGAPGTACEDITRALMQNNTVEDYQQTAEYCAAATRPDYVNNQGG